MKSEIQQIRDDLTALRTRDSDTAEALGKRLLETQKERRESTVILQGLLAQTDAFESQARAEIKRVSGR
jgi:isochorismate synthase EntC